MPKGLGKVPSGRLGQEHFPVGQVTFHVHLSDGQGPRKVISQSSDKKGKQN